jgi:hypothetical protein
MDIGYIDETKGKFWVKETESISAMIGGLIRTKKNYLQSRR